MGDYTPVHAGLPLTFTASAAVVGGQPVEITGDMQVGPAAATSAKVAGVAGYDCPAGSTVTVHTPGSSVEEVAVAAAVAAGAHVKAAGAGRVTGFVAGTDPEPARLGLCIKGQTTVGQPCRYLTA
jgi:hypothetical protein